MTRKIVMLAVIVGAVAAGAYYFYYTRMTPDAQIRRFARLAPKYGRLPMKQAFESLRAEMRYPLKSAGSADESPVAELRAGGRDMKSPWYQLSIDNASAFGAGRYWLRLSIMRPKITSAATVVTKELGPAQGMASGGDPAWMTATGAVVVDETVPSVLFAAGDPRDAMEVQTESHLPSYAEAMSRLDSAWVAAGHEVGGIPGSTIHRFTHVSGRQVTLGVVTRGEKPEVLGVSLTALNSDADATALLNIVLPDVARVLKTIKESKQGPGRCTASPAGNYVVTRRRDGETHEMVLWKRVEFRGWPVGYFNCDELAP